MKNFLILVLGLTLLMSFNTAAVSDNGHVYSTWDVLELDACASAWLIKNFVDKEADFKFFTKGSMITEGVPFDTPDAKLTRTQRKSTFENILQEYKIKDKALVQIGEMIHSIEIDFWLDTASDEAKNLNQSIIDITKKNAKPHIILQKSFSVFNDLYNSLNKN